MNGYGYDEEWDEEWDDEAEDDGPIIEQTSSSPSHYELMTIIKALNIGLGISDDDEDEDSKPYLMQIMDQLSAIEEILVKSHEASEAIRADAQVILEAHEKSANEYMKQLDLEKPIDPYPFISVPPETTVKELPEGGRLFTLPDGNFVQTTPDLKISFTDNDGNTQNVAIQDTGKVPLPNSYLLMVDMDVLKTTKDVAGIEGIPANANITKVGDKKFRVELEEDIRIEIVQADRMAIVINPSGIIDLLSIDRIEGIGEVIDVRLISGGAKGFACQTSKHQGMIESNATINLSLADGRDLIIHFPSGDAQEFEDGHVSKTDHFICEDNQ